VNYEKAYDSVSGMIINSWFIW